MGAQQATTAAGASVVDDILEVSHGEAEEAARGRGVAGGPRQPAVPNVPAAAMKCVLPEVREKGKGKGWKGIPRAGERGQQGGRGAGWTGGRTGKGKGKGEVASRNGGKRKGHLRRTPHPPPQGSRRRCVRRRSGRGGGGRQRATRR